MAGPLVIDRQAIAALCGKYAVRRLVLFGSAGTDHFDEVTSDIDFLVEFDDAVLATDLAHGLGQPRGRQVPGVLHGPRPRGGIADGAGRRASVRTLTV